MDGGTVMTYGKGKYFGELALQVKQPRTPKPYLSSEIFVAVSDL